MVPIRTHCRFVFVVGVTPFAYLRFCTGAVFFWRHDLVPGCVFFGREHTQWNSKKKRGQARKSASPPKHVLSTQNTCGTNLRTDDSDYRKGRINATLWRCFVAEQLDITSALTERLWSDKGVLHHNLGINVPTEPKRIASSTCNIETPLWPE